MNTFLPYPDMVKSAIVLDRQRLGKQRIEVLQILKTLHEGGAWENHPAVKMWRGYERLLIHYGLVMCDEWRSRGYEDTCYEKIAAYIQEFNFCEITESIAPPWYGDPYFHASHQSNLLRKNPEWYGHLFRSNVANNLPYVWPVQ